MRKIDFHRTALADREWIGKCLEEDPQEGANFPFATNFVWGGSALRPEVAQAFGCCTYRCLRQDGTAYFTFPVGGGDKKAVLDALREDCRETGEVFALAMMSPAQAAALEAFYPGQFLLTDDRDVADYVYFVNDLALLPGGRYQPKRNHVRRFKALAEWSFEPLDDSNARDCLPILDAWMAARAAENGDLADEFHDEDAAIRLALGNISLLGLFGGVLRQRGRAVAFTIGDKLTDEMAVANFEKALPDVEGAYQTINQEFAKWLAAQGYALVNREEDAGFANLRKAKLSYHPCRLVRKYAAEECDVTSAALSDRAEIAALWADAFHDDPEYVRLFLERRADPDSLLVVREDEGIAAMGAFIPAEVRLADGETLPVRYAYALAVAPSRRRRGLASRLLDFASTHYGVPLVLVPSDNELEAFYAKRGFVTAFRAEEWTVETSADGAKVSFRPADAKTFLRRREAFFRGEILRWDENAVSFSIKASVLAGGECLETENGETALYERAAEGAVRIVELAAEPERREAVVTALLARTGAKRAFYRNRGGMIHYPKDYAGPLIRDGYLGLALD